LKSLILILKKIVKHVNYKGKNMKKLLVILAVLVLSACTKTATAPKATASAPSFVLDYTANCTSGGAPTISGNSILFGSGTQCQAGRVVSTQSYANITEFRATVDLSKLSNNYVNASIYLIQNPNNPTTQPIGNNYCDAGGNNNQWNCRELDLMETNGNKLFQTTLHLGTGGSSAPQRYEYAYSSTALNNSCFNSANMKNDPANGLYDATAIDMSKPFDLVTTITYDTPRMVVTYQQGSTSVVVYDTYDGTGAQGSGTVDMTDLVATMQNGYWPVISFWQGYSPTGPSTAPWWNGSCGWGALCNSTSSYWSVSNIQVTTSASTAKK
jgi:hypothetical protein